MTRVLDQENLFEIEYTYTDMNSNFYINNDSVWNYTKAKDYVLKKTTNVQENIMAVEKEKAHKYEQQIWNRLFKGRGVNADIRINTLQPIITIIFLDVSLEIHVKYEKRNGQHVLKALTMNQKEPIMDRSTIALDLSKVEETGEVLTFVYGFMNIMSDKDAGIRLFLDHVMDEYWRDKETKSEEYPF